METDHETSLPPFRISIQTHLIEVDVVAGAERPER
jgi:hypothetical protein